MNRYTMAGAAALLLLAATTTHAQQQQLPQTPQPTQAQQYQRPADSYAYPQSGQPPASLYRRSALGITLGWGAPYGWGFDYAHMVSPRVDVNAGFGLGISGAKIGVGSRFYLAPEKKVSPYFGANLVLSSATSNSLDIDGDYTEYTTKANTVLNLRSGLRWQPGRVGLLGTLGYGVRLGGDPIVYNSTNPNPTQLTRDFAQAIGPGGLELSLGISIGLGR
ncbi:hypothetical protein [Hymenobacter lapidiphilus]|uniref:hypothetical protein n=1 Tax=Hymenobacter sp. CCM 8763 TaxID=2303334 RepID=UPI0011C16E0E|nr:hypothetical protein [Hymenobacter sp. CCM 8763]